MGRPGKAVSRIALLEDVALGTRRARTVIGKVFVGVGFTAVVVVLLLWLAGRFEQKIGETVAAGPEVRPIGDIPLVAAEVIEVPAIETAVGTVRAVHETAIASKLLARVVQIEVKAGQDVKKGEVLVRLDDRDLRARLKQAEARVAAAQATRDQAKVEFDRVERLVKEKTAAPIEFDRVKAALLSAEADLLRAQQAQKEAETILGYATITSPIDGRIVDKQVEAGDTATPGQVLLTLFDPTRMQMVASVRESLTHRLKIKQRIGVRIDALGKTCMGTVSEIVPEAESASRSFSVKVTGPCPPGVYMGMFGRLLIPLGTRRVLVVPGSAIQRVGQLDVVNVADADGKTWQRRIVRLGRRFGDQVEVLSGLRAGERILARPQAGDGA